ncbi:MAG: mechanosensitive ion channel family protein, partial [Cetobacterium sp.]
MENIFQNMLNESVVALAKYSPIVLRKGIRLAILFISYGYVKDFCIKFLKKFLRKKGFEELVVSFLAKSLKAIIMVCYAIDLINVLGLKTTSFLTILGSMSLGVGLALKGSLSDVAGGIQILMSKPFKKGDFIIACGAEGSVQKIGFLNTILNTVDNKKVIVPNGKISSAVVTTVTANPIRRADFLFFTEKEC